MTRGALHLPPLELDAQTVIREGFPEAVGFTPASRRDPRALGPDAGMTFFPLFLRRSGPRERGTLRFCQYAAAAGQPIQEISLTPAGGPTFVLMRHTLGEGNDLGAVAYLAGPEPGAGRMRWSRRARRGDDFAFDLRFPYEADSDERVALIGIHPGELAARDSAIVDLEPVSGWRLTSFDERLVGGLYWQRLASGFLAPHSGTLEREVEVTALDDEGVAELAMSLGLAGARGQRYERGEVAARLGVIFGSDHELAGHRARLTAYRFEATAHESFWAVYGLFRAIGLEAPHLRRVIQQIERRPVGTLTLADAGYRFELERPGIAALLGGQARIPILDGDEALTAQVLVDARADRCP